NDRPGPGHPRSRPGPRPRSRPPRMDRRKEPLGPRPVNPSTAPILRFAGMGHNDPRGRRPHGSNRSRMTTRILFVFFLVSGFASLVYEVVWLRLGMAQFGVTT